MEEAMPLMSRRKVIGAFGLCLGPGLLVGPEALSQAASPWPTRPIKFILPFGPGSGIDVGARLISGALSAKWGQPVVIENRPGGDGLLAMTAFLNADDDHVLLFGSAGSYTIHPYQLDRLTYNFDRDVVPLAQVANTIIALSVPGRSQITSLQQLMALARSEPGKLNGAYAQGITEMVFDGFLKKEQLRIEKVPYKDIVQAVPDLIEQRINVLYTSYAVVRPVAEAGSVRVLAVGSRERVPSLPNIPTAREAGAPSLELDGLSGLFGPRKLSPALRQQIGADVVEVMRDPVILERLAASGQTPVPGGADVLAASVRQQAQQVSEIAALLGLEKKSPR
jgi:tripartite-type tricarboxylate transporter receptor subunit TctC